MWSLLPSTGMILASGRSRAAVCCVCAVVVAVGLAAALCRLIYRKEPRRFSNPNTKSVGKDKFACACDIVQ